MQTDTAFEQMEHLINKYSTRDMSKEKYFNMKNPIVQTREQGWDTNTQKKFSNR